MKSFVNICFVKVSQILYHFICKNPSKFEFKNLYRVSYNILFVPRPLTTKRSFTLIEVISILDWGYWPVWPLGSEFSNDLIENLSEEINSGKIFLARSCFRRGKSSSSLFSRKLLAEWQTLGQSQSLAASKANLDSLDFTLYSSYTYYYYSLFLVSSSILEMLNFPNFLKKISFFPLPIFIYFRYL